MSKAINNSQNCVIMGPDEFERVYTDIHATLSEELVQNIDLDGKILVKAAQDALVSIREDDPSKHLHFSVGFIPLFERLVTARENASLGEDGQLSYCVPFSNGLAALGMS